VHRRDRGSPAARPESRPVLAEGKAASRVQGWARRLEGLRISPESKEPLERGPLLGTLAQTTEVSQGATTSTIVHWHHLLVRKMANQ
jgi:hypothetical protein